MSRTYKVRRNSGDDWSGVKKVYVLFNKRGAKKFQQMTNKRCRRLDKVAIAKGINNMLDDHQDMIAEMMDEVEAGCWDAAFMDDFDDFIEPPFEEDPFEEDPLDNFYYDDLYANDPFDYDPY